jgi:hypothetical protein
MLGFQFLPERSDRPLISDRLSSSSCTKICVKMLVYKLSYADRMRSNGSIRLQQERVVTKNLSAHALKIFYFPLNNIVCNMPIF